MALTLGVLPSSSTSFDSIIFWICSPMSQKQTSMPTTLIPKGGGREGKGREGGREGGEREGGRKGGRESGARSIYINITGLQWPPLHVNLSVR